MSEARFEPFALFDHQREADNNISRAVEAGTASYVVEAATGTGKTIMSAERACTHIARDAGARILYLCQRRGLLGYARDVFARQLGPDVSTGIVSGKLRETGAQAVFAMLQTMYSSYEDNNFYRTIDPETYDLIVVDEGQHGPAPTYREVIDYFRFKERAALSAVPYRHDGLSVNGMFGPTVYSKTLPESMAEGLVAPMRYHLHADKLLETGELEELAEAIAKGKLNRQFFIPRRDEEIVQIFGEELSGIEKPYGLIFCKTIAHAERMARLIRRKLPYSVAPIHSNQHTDVQAAGIQAIKDGDIQLATVVGMFDEGIDVPHINFLGLLNDTSSEGLWLNRIGRGLRLHPGKDEVLISDVTNSLKRIRQLDKLNGLRLTEETRRKPAAGQRVQSKVEFRFSTESIDISEVANEIRRRIEEQQSMLAPDDTYHIEPVVMPTSLLMPIGKRREKRTPLSPVESVILSYMFNAEFGLMSEKELRAFCRDEFSCLPAALRSVMQDLSDGGFVSRVAVPVDGINSQAWRLTNETIEAFLKIEPYWRQYRDMRGGVSFIVGDIEKNMTAKPRDA